MGCLGFPQRPLQRLLRTIWEALSLESLGEGLCPSDGEPLELLKDLLGWHVCRTELARKMFFEARIFSRKMLRNSPRYLSPYFVGQKKSRQIPCHISCQISLPKIKKKYTDELLQERREKDLTYRWISKGNIIVITVHKLLWDKYLWITITAVAALIMNYYYSYSTRWIYQRTHSSQPSTVAVFNSGGMNNCSTELGPFWINSVTISLRMVHNITTENLSGSSFVSMSARVVDDRELFAQNFSASLF